MTGLITILLMSALLGSGSFAVGMLPLSFAFSKSHLAKLSTLGTGLLLGAALGVIIPEGIETISSSHQSSGLPTSKIALSLLTGFTFMLLVEQFTSHSAHSHSHSPTNSTSLPYISLNATKPVDVDLEDLDREEGLGHVTGFDGEMRVSVKAEKAYPLTLGLVMHGLADGLALGVSALGNTESDLSLVVFLALIIHKAPTALGLTTSLLSNSLPRSECKKHIAFFSLSTPLGAIVSYVLFSFLEAGGEGDWTGIALLISGGTFLYVATVLQPVSDSSSSNQDEMNKLIRVALMVSGMFIPFAIGAIIGHGHEHGHGEKESAYGV